MQTNRILFLLTGVLLASTMVGCATSPTGRAQFLMNSPLQMEQMGAAAFTEMRGSMPRSSNVAQTELVHCVANAMTGVLTPEDMGAVVVEEWEVELFDEPSANAFALPGGKMGVHTGLLDVAQSPAQLAAVMGHEVAHVLARHSNERISRTILMETGMSVAATIMGADTPAKEQLMGALGVGMQYGVTMPFGRKQESEADTIGLMLMARAGFNPQESVWLWENMGRAAGGQAPPEFMSTHPSHTTRIVQLRGAMPEAVGLYEQAVDSGWQATCRWD
jgi:predicted Zn-dependent protease